VDDLSCKLTQQKYNFAIDSPPGIGYIAAALQSVTVKIFEN
jgi:hypothetical protein